MMQYPHVIESDFQHYYKCVGIQIFDEPAGC